MITKLHWAKKATKKASGRLDVQVITLVAVYTLFAILVVSQIYWNLSFKVMMSSLENRVFALYQSVEEFISPDSFYHINTPQDMETPLYQSEAMALTNMKNASGVLYLFTAKVNDQGEFVYVLDGLEQDKDFRYPNDPIEEEIIPKMKLALQDQQVMPENILHTDWGDIFMAYLPFHDQNGTVIGVVGIEFDATDTYATLKQLNTYTPFIAVFLVISAIILSSYLLRRISNPLYLDRNTEDSPTGLKNRNAFETDRNNLIARGLKENVGIVVIDINGLKVVNDRLGHSAGDKYITLVANAIRSTKSPDMVAYRTGGDEFVLLVQDASLDALLRFTTICSSKIKSQKTYSDMRCSIACGTCIFDETLDKSIDDTFNRADAQMYEEKRRQKESSER